MASSVAFPKILKLKSAGAGACAVEMAGFAGGFAVATVCGGGNGCCGGAAGLATVCGGGNGCCGGAAGLAAIFAALVLPLHLCFKRLDAVVEVLHLAKQVLLHGFDFLQALLHLWIAVDGRIRLRITG